MSDKDKEEGKGFAVEVKGEKAGKPSVGEAFRDRMKKKKDKGNSEKAVEILGKRKELIRRIQGLDPWKDAKRIRDLRKQADELLDEAKKEGLSLEGAYAVALVK